MVCLRPEPDYVFLLLYHQEQLCVLAVNLVFFQRCLEECATDSFFHFGMIRLLILCERVANIYLSQDLSLARLNQYFDSMGSSRPSLDPVLKNCCSF